MSGEGGARRGTVGFVTIGCKVNSADSRMLAEAFAADGWDIAEPGGSAELFVVNTCTVTHRADADARAAVRRLRRANPDARIVATGCMAEVSPEALAELPELDDVVGNRGKAGLSQFVGGGAEDAGDDAAAITYRDPEAIIPLTSDAVRTFVKVQDGCNNACSYCIIPRARGRSRSLPVDEVLTTVAHFSEIGTAEIVLAGIHIGMYGRDLPDGPLLAGLLDRIDQAGAVPRVRLSSLEPDELDDELLSVLARPRFCRHLHLPLQSGDDETLRRMKRRYDTADYARVLAAAHAALPGVAVGADVIAGFPGESDESFQRTYDFIASQPLAYLHVFAYSRRSGTPAARMAEQVDPRVIKKRVRALRELGAEKRRAFHERRLGQVAEALVLSEGRVGERPALALTGDYVTVALALAPADARPGSFVKVELQALDGDRVAGRCVVGDGGDAPVDGGSGDSDR